VVAVDTWEDMRRQLRPGSKPRLALVDLSGLPNPEQVLADLRVLMKPGRVLALTSMASPAAPEIGRRGFRALARPFAIQDVVRAVREMLTP